MQRSRLLSTFLMLSFSVPALAQDPDTAVVPLGEIVVSATRPVATTGGASALEVRLDSLRIQAAPTLDQILRRTPLVQVRMNSRGESQFSLRGSGSDARQVAVIIDGIPLNFAWDDRADLSVLPSSAAQSLTIARGLPSLLYGPNILGGVVEIGVARGSYQLAPGGLRMDAGVDHTGAAAIGAAITHPAHGTSGSWLLRAGGGHRRRTGLPLPNDVSEPSTTADDDDVRLNTDLVHTDAFASVSYRARRGVWADASVSGFTAERGIPAELHISEPRFWRYPDVSRLFAVVAGGTGTRPSPLGGLGDVELSIGADVGHTKIEQFASRAYETINATEEADDRNLTLRVRADQSIGRTGELRAGLTYSDINHDELLMPGGAATYRQRLWSGALELHEQLRGSGTHLSAGLAIDGADTPASGDKPALGALTQLAARAGITSAVSTAVVLHAGASRRARFPSLRELYSGALGRFEPNPQLMPEQLVALEAGGSFAKGNAQAQVVLFQHVLSDAIVRVGAGAGRFKRVNRDRQTGSGLEVLGGLRLDNVALSADLVLQRTRLEDPSAGTASEGEYQPAVIAGAGLALNLPLAVRFDASSRYTGRQHCVNPDTGGNTRIAAAYRVDAEISRSWSRSRNSAVELAAGIDNATDAAIYDQCGLPQAGRTFRMQLRLR
ncbi:MAG: TonB-dependent receptor [Gemmatimonadota bacterium]